jgi:hypothetical protein
MQRHTPQRHRIVRREMRREEAEELGGAAAALNPT